MVKIFNRIVMFRIQGEIYDNKTKPEDVLKSYNWSFRNQCDRNKIFLVAYHSSDSLGNITKITPLYKINKDKQKQNEYLLV